MIHKLTEQQATTLYNQLYKYRHQLVPIIDNLLKQLEKQNNEQFVNEIELTEIESNLLRNINITL